MERIDLKAATKSTLLTLAYRPPSRQKTATAGFYMRRVHPPSRYQAGTSLLHAGFIPAWLDHHRFPTRAQKGQTSSAALPCTPAPRSPLVMLTPPGVLRVSRRTLTPLSNIELAKTIQQPRKTDPPNYYKINFLNNVAKPTTILPF